MQTAVLDSIVTQYLPLLLLELALMVWALVDIGLKKGKVRHLNLIAWLLIVVLINILGPIAYFFFGRSKE